MTRRERHIYILESFGEHKSRYFQDVIIARMGLAAFTDEAIEAMARERVSSFKRQQRYNREHRERLAKAGATA